MKIKQEGSIPSWELDLECGFCHTIITLEGPQDMYAKPYLTGKVDGPYPDYGIKYYCTCPTCQKKIRVPRKKIREDIVAKIEE